MPVTKHKKSFFLRTLKLDYQGVNCQKSIKMRIPIAFSKAHDLIRLLYLKIGSFIFWMSTSYYARRYCKFDANILIMTIRKICFEIKQSGAIQV